MLVQLKNNDSILPSTSLIGDNHIKFVEKIKVLGLIMDKNLAYIDHGKEIRGSDNT